MTKYIGIHINSNKINIRKWHDKKCKIIQFFVDTTINIKNYDNLISALKRHKIDCIVHGSYTINLANNWNEFSWWIQLCINEIKYSSYIGAIGYIIHIGKQLKLLKTQCYNNMYTALLYIYEKTKNTNIKILLETPSGQGTELCDTLEELSYFYNKFSKNINIDISNRFKICLK